jgi:eukaryotic-like serine/threonine-protein kinase
VSAAANAGSVDRYDTLVAPARDRSLVLGRYRLSERLGAGGFGVVWRAHDELLHRDVAVKRIPLPDSGDRERANREALAAARLAHPAIVALYEACSDDDNFYLISELVPGQTLARLIASGELSDEEILRIGVAIGDALEHAHARGVVHRDVKPQNVLVGECEPSRWRAPGERSSNRPAIAKLTDFGGARLAGEDALTRTGDVLGTLAYMAPEQSDGLQAGPPADLYSLALVLYEALSGVNPVRGPTPAATVRRIGRPLEPLERHRRDLPRPLTRAIDAALFPEPEDRGTLAQLRAALQDTLEQPLGRSMLGRRHAATTARLPLRRRQAGPSGPAPPEHTAEIEYAVAPAAERHGDPDEQPRSGPGRWLTLPRGVWLAGALALCAWQVHAGRPSVALLALGATLPIVMLVRRPGPQWLAAGLAPLLGLAGLAGAFPALAGQAARWRSRALLGALGCWWLALAERLPTVAAIPAVSAPPPGIGLALGAVLWALAATLLPWIVRGRNAVLDALAAIAWATALAAATALLDRGLHPPATQAAPRDALLGAALGAVLAVAARALRGQVD